MLKYESNVVAFRVLSSPFESCRVQYCGWQSGSAVLWGCLLPPSLRPSVWLVGCTSSLLCQSVARTRDVQYPLGHLPESNADPSRFAWILEVACPCRAKLAAQALCCNGRFSVAVAARGRWRITGGQPCQRARVAFPPVSYAKFPSLQAASS
jgi:hypothetical protein